MNAKQELAIRIRKLIDDEITPDDQRILDVLSDYQVSCHTKFQQLDFERQVEHFLFAKEAEGVVASTVYNYRLHLSLFYNYLNKPVGDVTTSDIRDYMAYCSSVRKNKVSTIQSVLNVLHSFFSWMQAEEYLTKDPTARIKSFKINNREARHPLSCDQMELIRDACQNYREKALVEFLYSTGCRLSEALQIDVDNIDMQQCTVSIIGKGSKRRTLYFNPRTRLMIINYCRERAGGTALFCSIRRPYQRLGDGAVQKILMDIGNRAGVEKKIHPHIFRHTRATDLLNAGMEITIIQRVLGHANVGTTQIYAKTNEESVLREYRKYGYAA